MCSLIVEYGVRFFSCSLGPMAWVLSLSYTVFQTHTFHLCEEKYSFLIETALISSIKQALWGWNIHYSNAAIYLFYVWCLYRKNTLVITKLKGIFFSYLFSIWTDLFPCDSYIAINPKQMRLRKRWISFGPISGILSICCRMSSVGLLLYWTRPFIDPYFWKQKWFLMASVLSYALWKI